MHTHLEQELQHIKLKMFEMMDNSIEAIQKAVESLKTQNTDLADEVIGNDAIIDQLELFIDNECIKILVTKQPAAGDLRLVLAILKINTDLERVADLATNIAKQTKKLAGQKYIKPLVDISRMADICIMMIKNALDSITEKDVAKAQKIIEMDNEIDEINIQIYRELFSYMIEDPHIISQAIGLIMVSKALERMGDHVTNIAERAIYYIEGDDIRHQY